MQHKLSFLPALEYSRLLEQSTIPPALIISVRQLEDEWMNECRTGGVEWMDLSAGCSWQTESSVMSFASWRDKEGGVHLINMPYRSLCGWLQKHLQISQQNPTEMFLNGVSARMTWFWKCIFEVPCATCKSTQSFEAVITHYDTIHSKLLFVHWWQNMKTNKQTFVFVCHYVLNTICGLLPMT